MPRTGKIVRDVSQLSGKPLSETLEPSTLAFFPRDNEAQDEQEPERAWLTSPDLTERCLRYTPDTVYKMVEFLIANPNMSSSHLYRADILFDSLGQMKTPQDKERIFAAAETGTDIPSSKNRVFSEFMPGTSCGVKSLETYSDDRVEPLAAKSLEGFKLQRTVVRRLIPRNPRLDGPLNQTCHFYEGVEVDEPQGKAKEDKAKTPRPRLLVVYTPHVAKKEELPWYHPLIQSLAFLYDYEEPTDGELRDDRSHNDAGQANSRCSGRGPGTMSLHFLPFRITDSDPALAKRLERTLFALLNTHIRLARGTRSSAAADENGPGKSGNYNPVKDNIIPQHLIQNTYTRLKLQYAAELCEKWVEDTEPSKHVFEDLSIASFLIELWRNMYGVTPAAETNGTEEEISAIHKDGAGENGDRHHATRFPGFVDIACGNGVLVYVLSREGYQGWGFDARRRKTWSIFPEWVQARLKEAIYIPTPFSEAVGDKARNASGGDADLTGWRGELNVEIQSGIFSEDTFIISNHADELTVWTPLMAALSCPESPLPFLAIPCCSHSLSGTRFRYPPPRSKGNIKNNKTLRSNMNRANSREGIESGVCEPGKKLEEENGEADLLHGADNVQPASGDLKALRAEKQQAVQAVNQGKPDSSRYGSLLFKTMQVAEEIGYEAEKTLLRIPSTRNMAVVGDRRRVTQAWRARIASSTPVPDAKGTLLENISGTSGGKTATSVTDAIIDVIRRECAREGGIDAAATRWIERAMWLHKGPGKGNQ